ncbi:MAG: aspartate:alanine exchanger family transporter [Bacteroidia bacterium]|nr:aspartate:alanine exchanger family transporter [Bacteroidia bacterium]
MHETAHPEEALLYLFLAAAIGSFIGNIKFRGNSLGVAAVLFVGLALGAMRPEIQIPDVIKLLGLAIFVYSIGLSSGPAFFGSMKNRGTANLIFAVLALSLLSICIGAASFVFGFDSSGAAGLLAGITTNTPALAGLLDAIQAQGGEQAQTMANNAVVGYSISYPMGVLGLMVAVAVMQRVLRVNFQAETLALANEFPSGQPIVNQTLRITEAAAMQLTLRDFKQRHQCNVVFGRFKRGDNHALCHWELVFQPGDLVTITGETPEVARVAALMGPAVEEDLSDDRSVFTMRRIVVSNPAIAGKTVASLNLPEQYRVVLTRIRRGDVDSLVQPETVLELGDRIRVLAREEDLKSLEKIFGDSYEHLSHIDLLSFGLGMGLGILFGSVELTLPGGILFSLGFAGGPLVAGLLLSFIRRSGPILWTLPYSANLTLRQIGLMLMLAAIGINSGATFLSTMLSPVGPQMFLSGAVVSLLAGMLILLVGYKVMKIPFILLIGMISHHPANLEFANNQAQNKIPTYGYALVYPLLLIGKIVFVQMLWQLLKGLG